ncbi:phage Gp19/Gp15/Gp42 family protein [Faecalibacillus faecis]|uniref:phage Gp19/Gp15/Gp42 family protein n=1 Tax=Faecalibacillus faecis TaxID=1982628 RepID=UPI002F92379E
MEPFVTIEDVEALFRDLTVEENKKAERLLSIVSDCFRQEAKKVGKNLDEMIEKQEVFENVVKSVCVDVIARNLMTSTNSEPMEQMSQSALGYSVSGTFLVPGGGLFIKKSELARLGLKRQRMGMIEMYGND